MSATNFLVMYLIGSAFSWVAWIIIFFISRGKNFSESDNKISFFMDFIGGSATAVFGWPFALLFFAYTALFNK